MHTLKLAIIGGSAAGLTATINLKMRSGHPKGSQYSYPLRYSVYFRHNESR